MKYMVTYWYWQNGVRVPCCVYTFDEAFTEKDAHSYAYGNDLNYDGFYATKHNEILEY